MGNETAKPAEKPAAHLLAQGKKWPVPEGRKMPMEVLVLGLCRTGTNSMMAALEQLGYKEIHHMYKVYLDAPSADFWTAAIEAKYEGKGTEFDREAWDHMLGNCMATTDLPSALSPLELLTAYPTARVILTTRPINAWYASMLSTVYLVITSRALAFLALVNANTASMHRLHATYNRHIFKNDFPKYGKQVFEKHNAFVRSIAPPGRFLEYEVGMGWEPLCEFLGKDVPRGDFPRNNGREKFSVLRRSWAGPAAGRLVGVLVGVVTVGVVVGAVWWR